MCKLTFVFAPLAVTRRFVVYPSEKLEVVYRYLLSFDAQFVVELPLRCTTHALYRCIQAYACLSRNSQRMGAACVGPHVWEGDLLRRALLKEQAVLRVKEKDGKSAVEQSLVDVLHQMAWISVSRLQ